MNENSRIPAKGMTATQAQTARATTRLESEIDNALATHMQFRTVQERMESLIDRLRVPPPQEVEPKECTETPGAVHTLDKLSDVNRQLQNRVNSISELLDTLEGLV